MRAETRYVRTAGGYVAYQVIGAGPRDILFVTNWGTNLDAMWEEPAVAHFFHRLSRLGRVILFDKRGTGVSDPVPLADLPSLEVWMDDARLVLDAVGSKQSALIGDTEGGPSTCGQRTTSSCAGTSLPSGVERWPPRAMDS